MLLKNLSPLQPFSRRIPNTETYTLSSLYPDTLYYFWLAARSQRGEGATTPPIPVRTKQYGKLNALTFSDYLPLEAKFWFLLKILDLRV